MSSATDRRASIPPEIVELADARALARAGRDWPEADRLRVEIEAAGWEIVDAGLSYRLTRAHAPTVERGGLVRYGRSVDVPSRLQEPALGLASVVLVATDFAVELERCLASLVEHGPDGLQIVVVGDALDAEQEAALVALDAADPGAPGIGTEVVVTSERLGHGAALNAGIRRAAAATVVCLDTSIELTGDAISPLVAALEEPDVAIAGPFGLASADLRQFEEAAGEVDAVAGYCQAFRRADYTARGPLDEKFRFYRNLDIWWSLVLRDEGEDTAPRRAVALDRLPLLRHEHRGWTSLPEAERNRLSKRNFYRLLDRFGRRLDLVDRAGRIASGT